MKILKKLQNPLALVAQGFVVGGLLFLATHAEPLLAAGAVPDPAAPLLPSAERAR